MERMQLGECLHGTRDNAQMFLVNSPVMYAELVHATSLAQFLLLSVDRKRADLSSSIRIPGTVLLTSHVRAGGDGCVPSTLVTNLSLH